jgi:uncharacterized tellurite resistance protein B-like protein
MLSRLKEWFKEFADESTIDKQNKALMIAFAGLFADIIKADEIQSEQEKDNFFNFFTITFKLNDEEADELYTTVMKMDTNLDEHLETFKREIDTFEGMQLRFMSALNSVILSDGIDNREYERFEYIRKYLSSK